MPGIDGIEVARRLRERGKSAIVFLTVHRARQVVEAALESGAQGFVIKSCAGEELIPAISAATRSEEFISPRSRLLRAELSESPPQFREFS